MVARSIVQTRSNSRDYDPRMVRFMESDPIGVLKRSVDQLFSAYNKPLNDNDLAYGINHLYGYVRRNPVKSKPKSCRLHLLPGKSIVTSWTSSWVTPPTIPS